MKTGDWAAAVRLLQEKLRSDNANPLALLRLALALRAVGRDADAVDTADRAIALAQQKLPTVKKTRWLLWDLSIGSRLLDRKDDAYTRLHQLLAAGGFPDPVLGPRDPALDVFKSDPEFRGVWADLEKTNAEIRARILQIESAFDRDNGRR
jgi:tetratricopeptide (TPR) repeat protein